MEERRKIGEMREGIRAPKIALGHGMLPLSVPCVYYVFR